MHCREAKYGTERQEATAITQVFDKVDKCGSSEDGGKLSDSDSLDVVR